MPELLVDIILEDGVYDAPAYATGGSAGVDLIANTKKDIAIWPGDIAIVNAGISVHIRDPNVAMIIVPRSGKGSKGLVIGNLIGVVDSDYQGPVRLVLWNRNQEGVIYVRPRERVAQALFVPVYRPTFNVVSSFESGTDRGTGGFGSTGDIL